MELKFILDTLRDYGWYTGGAVVGIFILLKVIKTTWFKNIFSKLTDKLVEKMLKNKTTSIQNIHSLTESDISNHDIFNYIDFWTYSKIPTITFSTEYRTAVFRKYLSTFLKSYKKNLQKFALEREYQEMDDAELLKNLLDLINRTIYDYERELLDSGLPKVIIEKMKIKNNDTLLLILDLINSVCSSPFYDSKNNLLKVYSILNIILSVLESTVNSAESVCNSINGQLKGLTFEGKTEP
jgi:hypothetical protein